MEIVAKIRQLFARLGAWLSWRRAKAEPARINRPAPAPAILRQRPARITVAGTTYYRDARGTLWRVMREDRDAAGNPVFVVGRRVPRIVRAPA